MKLTTRYDEGAGGRFRWYDRNRETGKVEAGCVQVGFRTREDAEKHRKEYIAAIQCSTKWYRHPSLLPVAFAVGVLIGALTW